LAAVVPEAELVAAAGDPRLAVRRAVLLALAQQG
jgi:hypothetical protein